MHGITCTLNVLWYNIEASLYKHRLTYILRYIIIILSFKSAKKKKTLLFLSAINITRNINQDNKYEK